MKVAVLGLGIIGSRVAARYRDAGHTVAVWSRTPREVEGFASTPAAATQDADVIQIFVNDGFSLLQVLENCAPSLRKGQVVINSATVSPLDTAAAAALAQAAGADFLDCPFTGSRDASAAGQLVYYVGGDAAVLEKVRPLLEASAKEIVPVGKIGDATALKIATNMVTSTIVEALSEALAVTESAGVAPEMFLRAMESNASCSGLVKMKLPTMIRGEFAPHFSLQNMLKDARFALEMGAAAGLRLPALQAAADSMTTLADEGRGAEDFSVLRTLASRSTAEG